MKQQSSHHNFYRKRGLLIVTALMFSSLVSMDVNLLHAEENMTLTLKSGAFDNGGEIPSRYTCEGEDVSPPLVWTGVPEKVAFPGVSIPTIAPAGIDRISACYT